MSFGVPCFFNETYRPRAEKVDLSAYYVCVGICLRGFCCCCTIACYSANAILLEKCQTLKGEIIS